ncbi:MAG: hypothetical protein BWX50_01426 [Euryarchaeota archaeon ADurb.Bin009]|nr:MAG: hypothetical protein BWX50_01426 [Euryarchaeota archaeon ADurb.Bin009]
MRAVPSASTIGGSPSARKGWSKKISKSSTINSSRNDPTTKTTRSIPRRIPMRIGIPGMTRVRMPSRSVFWCSVFSLMVRPAIWWAKLCRLAAMIWATVIRCLDSISSAIVCAASSRSGFSPNPWSARMLSFRSAADIFPRLRMAASMWWSYGTSTFTGRVAARAAGMIRSMFFPCDAAVRITSTPRRSPIGPGSISSPCFAASSTIFRTTTIGRPYSATWRRR